MTLDEAIARERSLADKCHLVGTTKALELRDEHRQMAARLEELKMRREKGSPSMITYKKNEVYQEIELFDGDTKIGEAEVDINGRMLSRLNIYEPYQNRGLGTQVVNDLTNEYGLDVLWVNADNKRAIHVYEKCGYRVSKPGMFIMRRYTEEKV